ncbi:MAG: hypothetical protein HY685_03050 [Chloroflexi bacterium]|nr:hypothetical protein [Chloroflexota bacterium]
MRPELADLFERIIQNFLGASAYATLVRDPTVEEVDDSLAKLEAQIDYLDVARLALLLTVDFSGDFPEWRHYSFYFFDPQNSVPIFRYDNTPHHPSLPFFPHHRHRGSLESVEPCQQPSIGHIRREIEAHLAERTG